MISDWLRTKAVQAPIGGFFSFSSEQLDSWNLTQQPAVELPVMKNWSLGKQCVYIYIKFNFLCKNHFFKLLRLCQCSPGHCGDGT